MKPPRIPLTDVYALATRACRNLIAAPAGAPDAALEAAAGLYVAALGGLRLCEPTAADDLERALASELESLAFARRLAEHPAADAAPYLAYRVGPGADPTLRLYEPDEDEGPDSPDPSASRPTYTVPMDPSGYGHHIPRRPA